MITEIFNVTYDDYVPYTGINKNYGYDIFDIRSEKKYYYLQGNTTSILNLNTGIYLLSYYQKAAWRESGLYFVTVSNYKESSACTKIVETIAGSLTVTSNGDNTITITNTIAAALHVYIMKLSR